MGRDRQCRCALARRGEWRVAASGHAVPRRRGCIRGHPLLPRNRTPFLGTCGGFQHALVELARSRAGLVDAAHEESDPAAVDPVVSRLACSLVGEVRIVTPIAGTRFASICGTEPFEGYHYCRFGLDPAYVEPLERAGMVVGATAPDAGVEAIELPEHPFFLATAFQPQVGADGRGRLGPLLEAFVAASAAI